MHEFLMTQNIVLSKWKKKLCERAHPESLSYETILLYSVVFIENTN